MLKQRLVPVLLLRNGRLVKTIKFDASRDVGNPITQAKVYDAQNADELVFLDILATTEGRGALLDIVDRVTEECFVPLTVGGGVKTVEDIRALLKAGADKVAINTAAVENPQFLKEAVKVFGSANIVVSVDYKNVDGKQKVFIRGGKEETSWNVFEWCCEVERLGGGEILLNSIDRDGTMEGYDLETIKRIAESLNIPVVACGGAGTLQHLSEGLKNAKASAVAAGSIFAFTDQSPIKARFYLNNAGLNVRYGV